MKRDEVTVQFRDWATERTGFSHVEYLCAAFRQAVGLPPGAYRREHAQLP